jgi:hypothetical protein
MWKFAIWAAAVLGLAACSKPAVNGSAAAANAAATAPSAAVAAAAPPASAAPAAPSFTITVTLSPSAASQLQSLGQDVIVSADFYGLANAQGHQMAGDDGEVSLAQEVRVTMPGAGATTIPVPALNQSLFVDIQGGTPQLLINVFSGEGLNPDNKLDCSLFQDRLALAEQSGIQIACKLIGEN